MTAFDAVVVGAGPNGLSAAIVLARAGRSVLVLEGRDTIGGSARTAELTLPGFRHDVCSAIHPMGKLSPFFRSLPLDVEWIEPPFAIAHPLDSGHAAILEKSLDRTSAGLGRDAHTYRALFAPFIDTNLFSEILRPVRPITTHPILLAQFGLVAMRSAHGLVQRFQEELTRALLAGCAAHAIRPLEAKGTAAFALTFALSGHATGWPFAKGGSQSIVDALAKHLRSLGGEVRVATSVKSMRDIPPCRAVIFDVTPKQLAAIAGDELPPSYVRRLQRFRYGPGVFKIDWALDGPVPWRAADAAAASTVHVGGTFEEIAKHEAEIWRGGNSSRPFVLFAQQSLFDSTRAPAGKHTGWAYCHVPNGSTDDMTEAIEKQIERFAPGFRDRILARHTLNSEQLESYNPNLVGGDIGGGAYTLAQTVMRPFPKLNPYSTPNPKIFLGSSSAPPGGGVHGLCGFFAAQAALLSGLR
jgi:phytoene dehydrogenase-like protein